MDTSDETIEIGGNKRHSGSNYITRVSCVLLFSTFWGLSYFFLLLGKIPTFSYFFRLLLKLNDKNAIFKPKNFFKPRFARHNFLQ